MDLSLTVGLIVIAVLLFANAFFVASEFAIVKVRKTRILQLMHEGNKDAVSAYDLIEHMDNSLAAIQLGITIASIGLGWVGESTMVKLLEPLIEFLPISAKSATAHSIAVPFAFAFVTLAHVVIGELMPKSIAIQSTEKTSLVVAKPMNAIRNIFRPFTWILNGFGNILLRIFKIEASNVSRAHSVEELDMIIDASHKEGVLNDTEKEILQNVFKFSDLLAKQVMVPRPDVVAIDVNTPHEELTKLIIQNQYTRYPVFEDDLDNIIGMLHVKDIYPLICADKEINVKQILREAILIPETMTTDNIVLEFRTKKAQIAVVIDEFGSVSGIVTLEDVIEEIFGDVQDEFDEDELDIKQIYENEYVANAMMRIDEFNEFFDVNVEDEDVETLGGLVVKALGHIAQNKDVANLGRFTFQVLEVDGPRIVKIKIIRNEIEETAEEQQIN